MYQIKKVYINDNTDYSSVDIVDTYQFGKTLFLDTRLQSCQSDEFIYHESITHPALITHPEPKSVLVIGGAEGSSAREVLKHSCVERVMMVEIDKKLVDLCKEYMPEFSRGAFFDPKFEIFYGDGRAFVESTKEKFDVIISDLTAPLDGSPAYLLFTKEFYKIIFNKLTDDGIFSMQADSTDCNDMELFTLNFRTLSEVFPVVRGIQAMMSSYVTPWGFIVASKKHDPLQLTSDDIRKKINQRNITNLNLYDEEMHRSLFTLPRYLKNGIKNQTKIITDDSPFEKKV